jgi:hypothetical protein
MIRRVLSYVSLSLAAALLLSVLANHCGDVVDDGKREGNTILSRIAGLERYYLCEHVDTIHHGGSEWEWVWACEDAPTLMPKKSSAEPLAAATIEKSSWLRLVAWVETWHEGILGTIFILIGFVLYRRTLPLKPETTFK